MRTIAILGSWDTKSAEMQFLADRISAARFRTLTVDFSTLEGESPCTFTRKDILAGHEQEWAALAEAGRGQKIDFMAAATQEFVLRLYAQGEFQGVISAGGLQNTTIAVGAMRSLPRGFPKVLATTVASGHREFAKVTANSDIVVVPAVADFTGLNVVNRTTLETAADCIIGLLRGARHADERADRPVIGVTGMGVTNNGVVGALAELQALGFEPVAFHATGSGGKVMEDFVAAGLMDGVLDLTLHEIANEWFGGGFSHGSPDRLDASIDAGVPLLVCPGGLDFVDYYLTDFPRPVDGRKLVMHNGNLAHIKLLPQEAREVGAVVGRRLARATHPVPFLVPEDGFRSEAGAGDPLHDPEVDRALIEAVVASAEGKVAVEYVPLGLDSAEFGQLAARRFAGIYAAQPAQERQPRENAEAMR